MSRIGRKPISVPEAVTVEVAPGRVAVKGPKGELAQTLSSDMKVEQSDGTLTVARPTDRGEHRALHGLTRSLIANMVEGVTEGFEKRLEITGVGYKAVVSGQSVRLSLGYSHDVNFPIPAGIAIAAPKPTEISITGIDKRHVGQTAAEIRALRPPEPYKGKGVKYADEFIFRKEGKKK